MAVPKTLATSFLVLVSLVTVVCGGNVSQAAPSPTSVASIPTVESMAEPTHIPTVTVADTHTRADCCSRGCADRRGHSGRIVGDTPNPHGDSRGQDHLVPPFQGLLDTGHFFRARVH